MKQILFSLALIFLISANVIALPVNVGRSQTGFTENKGQFRDQHGNPTPDVLYMADFGGMKVQLRKDGFSYEVYQVKPKWVDPATIPYKVLTVNDLGDSLITWPGQAEAKTNQMYHFSRVDVKLSGANPQAFLTPELPNGDSKRYLVRGLTGSPITVKSYAQIRYVNIYNGIDLVFYCDRSSKGLKYDFIVRPGAKLSDITLNYLGASKLELDAAGNLEITNGCKKITESIPVCYTENANGMRTGFKVINYQLEENRLRFSGNVSSNSETLVIDPAVNIYWHTYLDGESSDVSMASVVDPTGNIFICGNTHSNNIATNGAYQDSLLFPEDGFLAKYTRSGQLLWSTYLNGIIANDMAINSMGELVIAGNSVIMKADSSGFLIWNRPFAGSCKAITFDNAENIIAVRDSVFKIDQSGNLLWKMKFGGSGTTINDVDCDAYGNIYIAGHTTDSTGISTPNGHLTTYNGTNFIGTGVSHDYTSFSVKAGDGFFAKITNEGHLVYGSYYGGYYFDEITTISVSDSGYFVVGGSTNSRNGISTPGSYQDTLRHQGTYGFTQIAIGFNWECPEGYWQYLDTCLYCSFHPAPYDNHSQSTDAFLAKFTPGGSRVWGSYYGDTDGEFGTIVNIDNITGKIVMGGITSGNMFVCDSSFCWQNHAGGCWRNISYPPSLSSRYSYYSPTNSYLWSFYSGAQAYLAQFNTSGQRLWGTYFPNQQDQQTTCGWWNLSGISYSDYVVTVSGTSNYPGGWFMPCGVPDAFLFSFAVSDMDTIIRPANTCVCIGDSAIITVGVTTSPPRDLEFSWSKNGVPIAGATDSVLVIPSAYSDTGWYSYRITQGNFSWTDSVNLTARENPAFQKLSTHNQELILSDAKIFCDLDNNGFYDVISQRKLVYNDSLSFVRYDSIPYLYRDIAITDLLNENNPFIFTHQARWNVNQQDCPSASNLIRSSGSQQQLYESETLNRVLIWADFDNDGKQEGFKVKINPSNPYGSALMCLVEFENDTIYEKFAGFGGYHLLHSPSARLSVADYNNDGNIDILFIGSGNDCDYNVTSLLIKMDSMFVEMPINLPINYKDTYAQWYDTDSDGDLDVLYSSACWNPQEYRYDRVVYVCRNDSSVFSKVFSDTIAMPDNSFYQPKPMMLDFDNDGILDILFSNHLLKKTGTTYIEVPSTYSIAHSGLPANTIACGDIDNDGDLDILGEDGIYRNDVCNPPNTPPTSPSALTSTISSDTVRFSWQRATDLQTPQMGLTYNLRVGTTPGGNNIMSSMSDVNGWRKVVGMGNVYQNTGWWLHSLSPGTYYWSVQAIDNSFAGGPFAPEQTFTIAPPVPVNTAVASDTVTTGQTLCFDATNTITAGGNSSRFKVQGGGAVTLIAGEKISFLPVVQVDLGGYLHGYITNSSDYCFQAMQPMVQAKQATENQGLQGLADDKPGDWMVKVYPNPTSGDLHLVLNNTGNTEPVQVNMYNLFGERVWSADMTGITEYTVSTELLPPGMYLLKVVQGLRSKIVKVIRN